MFIDSIELENVRTFAAKKKVDFVHSDTIFDSKLPKPKLTNINLLFGGNATGKTTILEAIALTTMGPTVVESRVSPRPLVRFAPNARNPTELEKSKVGWMRATLTLHGKETRIPRDDPDGEQNAVLTVRQKGELESLEPVQSEDTHWERAYSSNDDFFVVAYGATRRIEQKLDWNFSRKKSRFERANRIESVILEGCPLIPLKSWFAARRSKERRSEIIDLINSVQGKGHFEFNGDRRKGDGDFVFTKGGLDIPFSSLSDGYRGFLGWTTDLICRLDSACTDSKKSLREMSGIVLVDEIDLHLHPEWQLRVIANLCQAFPRLQFIVTSHSPLIAGSVEWMNIVHLKLDSLHRTGVVNFQQPIHGLDADQILVSDLFGLQSTRADAKRDELHDLTIQARRGDDEAAKRLISAMAKGLEAKKK